MEKMDATKGDRKQSRPSNKNDRLPISAQQYRLPSKPPVNCSPYKSRGPPDGLKPDPRGPRPQANSGQDRFRMMMEDIDADLHAGHSSGRTDYRQPLAFPEIPATSVSGILASGPAFDRRSTTAYPVAGIKAEPLEDDSITSPPTRSRSDFDRTRHSRYRHATQELSNECQKRGFNPHFIEWKTADGKYKCLVNINGKEIREQRSWQTPGEAKQAIAAFALQHNEHMVEPVRRSDAVTRSDLAAEQRTENPTQQLLGADHLDRERTDERPEVDEIPMETRVALACIRRTVGRHRSIPDDVMQNAQLARGFVMGFEYGSAFAEEDQSQRERSRSPASGGRRHGVDRQDHRFSRTGRHSRR